MFQLKRNHFGQSGFTLIELMVVLVLLAVFAALVGPGFQDSISRNAISAEANRIASTLIYARASAISTGQIVTVESKTGKDDWGSGWFVCIDTAPGPNPCNVSPQPLLRDEDAASAGQYIIKATAQNTVGFFSFLSSGRLNGAVPEQVLVCDANDNVTGRVIDINLVGRVTISEDVGDLLCP